MTHLIFSNANQIYNLSMTFSIWLTVPRLSKRKDGPPLLRDSHGVVHSGAPISWLLWTYLHDLPMPKHRPGELRKCHGGYDIPNYEELSCTELGSRPTKS